MSCCGNNNAVVEANESNRGGSSSDNLSNLNPLAEKMQSSRDSEVRANQAIVKQRLKNKVEKTKLMWTDCKAFANEYLQLTDGETKTEAINLANMVGLGSAIADIVPGLLELTSAIPFAGPLAKVVLMFYKVTKQYCKNSKEITELSETVNEHSKYIHSLIVKVALLQAAAKDWPVEMREAFEAMMTAISAATAFLLAEGNVGSPKLLKAAKLIVLNQTYTKLIEGIKSDLQRAKEGVMTQLTLYLLDLQIGDSDLKDFSNIFNSFSREIKMHLVRFQPGSREWILDNIRAWSTHAMEPILWVCATAGIGKSALSAQVWDYLNRNNQLSAVVFCKFGDAKRSDCTQVVLALAFQIATNATLPKQARELVKQGMAEIDKKSSPTIRDYWNCLILGPLKQLATSIPACSPPFVLMIDALDELERVEQAKLVSAIKSSAEDLPGFAKVFLTSRDEVQLKGILGSGDSITRESIVESDPRNISDLTLYINKILFDDQILSIDATDLTKEEALTVFLERSEKKFVYVAMVEAYFADLKASKDKKGRKYNGFTLDELKRELPDNLDDLYIRNFVRIRNDNPYAFRRHIQRLLRLLLVTREPLSVSLAASMIDMDVSEETLAYMTEQIKSMFPTKPGMEGYEVLYPFHKSLLDWMKKRKSPITEAVVEQQWRQDLAYEERLPDWEFYRLFSDFYVTEYQGHCLFASELMKRINTAVVPWEMPEITSDNYLFCHLPIHLHYARRPELLTDLLFNLDWLQKAISVRGANEFCLDMLKYRGYLPEPELKLLVTAIKLSMPALRVSKYVIQRLVIPFLFYHYYVRKATSLSPCSCMLVCT